MTIGDLFLLLLCIFAFFVACGTLILRVLGFSAGKGATITTTFIFFGFWNPVGWIVLGICIYLQLQQNRARLAARQATHLPAQPSVPASAGPPTAAGSRVLPLPVRQLRRGGRCT
jgi:hypothetical protein